MVILLYCQRSQSMYADFSFLLSFLTKVPVILIMTLMVKFVFRRVVNLASFEIPPYQWSSQWKAFFCFSISASDECQDLHSVQSITAGQTCPSLRQPTDKGLLLDPKLITNSSNAGRDHLKENYYSDIVSWRIVFLIISLWVFS